MLEIETLVQRCIFRSRASHFSRTDVITHKYTITLDLQVFLLVLLVLGFSSAEGTVYLREVVKSTDWENGAAT